MEIASFSFRPSLLTYLTKDVLGVRCDSHDGCGRQSSVVDRRYRVSAVEGDAIARVAGHRILLDRRQRRKEVIDGSFVVVNAVS